MQVTAMMTDTLMVEEGSVMAKTMFEKIKGWYPKLWNEAMVKNAVKKGMSPKEEFKEITGHDYGVIMALSLMSSRGGGWFDKRYGLLRQPDY